MCVAQKMDKEPKPLPTPQALTNGDAEFHQEALQLSPLQPESIMKKPTLSPIDMQGEGLLTVLEDCYQHPVARQSGHVLCVQRNVHWTMFSVCK